MTNSADPDQPEEASKAAEGGAPTPPPVRNERVQFRALILGNPNYFGTVKESKLPPVLQLPEDTAFEQLECIGFNPQLNLLEGVVWIKQSLGYGGDICSAGTQEYVRFYIDWNNSGHWIDQGMTSFTAYDIPGAKPLEYAVSLGITPHEMFCFYDNLPTVRAILSWDFAPPANTPGFIPVFGNVVEARIQIEPFKLILFSELLKEAKVTLPEQFASVIDLSQPIAAAKPQVVSLTERAAEYKDRAVPPHRFAFTELQQALAHPGQPGSLAALNVDLASIIGKLLETNGDTTYEQLTCIGLNPNLSVLEGTLEVKLASGYSGAPCTTGSYEYVAFWLDYGSGYTYVGTTAVNVHDFAHIPAGGLQYAVFLPVNFENVQQACQYGPKIASMRAILSWDVPPPPSNPNFVPVWGNRLDTLILVTPGAAAEGQIPYIDSVGDMFVCDIDQATGLATGTMVIAQAGVQQAPFGGEVTITGFITNAPNVLGGAVPLKYKVSVREAGGVWQPLANTFTVDYIEQNGGVFPFGGTYTQGIDGGGYYTYRPQNYPNQWVVVTDNVLARWFTSGPMTGLWEIAIEAKLPNGTIVSGGTFFCGDGTARNTVIVDLDQRAPSANVAITGYSRGGGPVQPASDCGKFEVGDVLYGTYSTFDPESHFGGFSLGVSPSGNAVSPSGGAYPVVSTNGQAGTWSLDTHGMNPCGYVINLHVSDRTIANSAPPGWQNDDSKGFCLEAAPVIATPKS